MAHAARMYLGLALLAAGSAASCGGSTTAGDPEVAPPEGRAGSDRSNAVTPPRDPQGLPTCGEPAAGSRRLDSYRDARFPATYWLDMVFEGTEWRPAEAIPMPHHHATRLELDNIAEFPALAGHQAKRLRFTVEVTSRDVRQVAGRDEWRATWQARILSVCIPAAP